MGMMRDMKVSIDRGLSTHQPPSIVSFWYTSCCFFKKKMRERDRGCGMLIAFTLTFGLFWMWRNNRGPGIW